MRKWIAGLATALTIWPSLMIAAPSSGNSTNAVPQLSATDQAAIDLAARRGSMLYAYDQAAWHGTDDMMQKLPNYADAIGGYIVVGPVERPQIIFVDRDEQRPHALYIGEMSNFRITSSKVADPKDKWDLTSDQLAMLKALANARQIMADRGIRPCSDAPFNTVALPSANPDEPIRVYFLTAQTGWQKIPFGGHYVVEVNAAGQASEPRAFTKGCIDFPVKSKKAEVAFITHLLDPIPTEIHIFSSYATQMPVVVGITTPEQRWFQVIGNSIQPLNMPRPTK